LKIIVVGGGLLGLASAQALLERGHEITVLEALDGVGLETSFANGGLITPSKSEPWNGPDAVRHLLLSIFKSSSAFVLRPKAIPSLIFWGIDFLMNSTPSRQMLSLKANFELASFSKEKTNELRNRLGLNFAHRSAGTLNVFREGESITAIRDQAEYLARLGLRYEELDTDGAMKVEPALKHAREIIKGAFFFPDDDSGDAHLFCRELQRVIVSAGATVKTGTQVTGIAVKKGAVIGVETGDGHIKADAVVIAAGNGSMALVRPLGLSLPIRPAKGYSLTLALDGIDVMPRTPVIDETRHAAVTPMNMRLRLTSTVEFAGFDKRIDPQRIDGLFSLLGELYPGIASKIDRGNATPWAGLRPVSSDGRPFIGPCKVPGLYINTGHGPLGWTLAMGSAHLLADLIDGRPPGIDANPFDAAR
jgi:D-amino-acid dehydrogenase